MHIYARDKSPSNNFCFIIESTLYIVHVFSKNNTHRINLLSPRPEWRFPLSLIHIFVTESTVGIDLFYGDELLRNVNPKLAQRTSSLLTFQFKIISVVEKLYLEKFWWFLVFNCSHFSLLRIFTVIRLKYPTVQLTWAIWQFGQKIE